MQRRSRAGGRSRGAAPEGKPYPAHIAEFQPMRAISRPGPGTRNRGRSESRSTLARAQARRRRTCSRNPSASNAAWMSPRIASKQWKRRSGKLRRAQDRLEDCSVEELASKLEALGVSITAPKRTRTQTATGGHASSLQGVPQQRRGRGAGGAGSRRQRPTHASRRATARSLATCARGDWSACRRAARQREVLLVRHTRRRRDPSCTLQRPSRGDDCRRALHASALRAQTQGESGWLCHTGKRESDRGTPRTGAIAAASPQRKEKRSMLTPRPMSQGASRRTPP